MNNTEAKWYIAEEEKPEHTKEVLGLYIGLTLGLKPILCYSLVWYDINEDEFYTSEYNQTIEILYWTHLPKHHFLT